MTSPEGLKPTGAPIPKTPERLAALVALDQQLEVADANENLIERTFKREQLLERRDELEADTERDTSSRV